MQYDLLATHSVGAEWTFFLPSQNRFILGGRDWSAAIPIDTPQSLERLIPYRNLNPRVASPFAANLPIPEDIHEALSNQDRCGLSFLSIAEYDLAVDDKGLPVGNVLLSLIYGQDYGTYMRMTSTKQIVSLRSGKLQLVERTESGFKIIDETKTRGRAALAFASHPHEPLLAYGDNGGTVHLHAYGPTGFAKATKVDDLKYKVSQLQFIDEGKRLLVGGMGYLHCYHKENSKYVKVASLETAVRGFHWSSSHRVIVINQGIHGIRFVKLHDAQLATIEQLNPEFPVTTFAVSDDLRHLAVGADRERFDIFGIPIDKDLISFMS